MTRPRKYYIDSSDGYRTEMIEVEILRLMFPWDEEKALCFLNDIVNTVFDGHQIPREIEGTPSYEIVERNGGNFFIRTRADYWQVYLREGEEILEEMEIRQPNFPYSIILAGAWIHCGEVFATSPSNARFLESQEYLKHFEGCEV